MAPRLKTRTPEPQASDGPDTQAGARPALPLHSGARLTARVALALALVAAALWTAAEFLPALIWAAILAVTIWPLYQRFESGVSREPSSLTALLFTLLVALIVFTPLALAIYQIAQQSDVLANWITQSRENGIKVPEWIARLPIAAETVQQWWSQNLADPQSAGAWLQSINAERASEFVKAFGGQLLHRLFMFFVALIALFVMLRNGRSIAHRFLLTSDRIFGDPGEGLAEKMVGAIRGTVNGTIVVAVAEGLLIGAAYVLAGVPNPVLFTVLTMAFAMLPFGAWAAFTAAALALIVSGGNGLAALAVFAWGALVMLTGDHYVWPTLVGGAARLPFLFAFVGIFGGIATFGLLGLFLGPVIMAALLTVWREWVIPPPAAVQRDT
jgi:predicted PurR-regulated permease PerM